MNDIKLVSEITCPKCGATSKEKMPEDACIFFWECLSCGKVSKPRPGDCCVFCSYGETKCPPVQKGNSECC